VKYYSVTKSVDLFSTLVHFVCLYVRFMLCLRRGANGLGKLTDMTCSLAWMSILNADADSYSSSKASFLERNINCVSCIERVTTTLGRH